MNPEERMRRLQDVDNWEVRLSKRANALPSRRAWSPMLISFATIAAVAIIGVVVFSAFGLGIRSAHPAAPRIVPTQTASPVPTASPTPTPTATGDAVVPWRDSTAYGLETDAVTTGSVPACDFAHFDGSSLSVPSPTDYRIVFALGVPGISSCAADLTKLSVSAGQSKTALLAADKPDRLPLLGGKDLLLGVTLEYPKNCYQPSKPSSPVTLHTGARSIELSDGQVALTTACSAPTVLIDSTRDGYNIGPGQTAGIDQLVASVDGPPVDESQSHPFLSFNASNSDLYVFYTVTLTNTGSTAFFFESQCPTFVEAVAFGNAKSALAENLHCSNVGPIAPGDHETFDMRLPIPEDATGVGGLVWSMTGGPSATYGVRLTK